SPFGFIAKLEGCRLGNRSEGIHGVKRYLERFGYLRYEGNDPHSDDDFFDERLYSAVRVYQANYRLNVTGELDAATASVMSLQRCGVPDIVNGTNLMISWRPYFSFFPDRQRWPPKKTHLSYLYLTNVPPEYIPAIDRAFESWASVTRFTFHRVEDSSDITVGYFSGDHGDGVPFDGPGGVLAHSFAPTDGRMHFDAAEPWFDGVKPDRFDVHSIAMHEIGHLLGLGHSSVREAIMWAYFGLGERRTIQPDDIDGIKALYN
ncbi:hypothetical protein M569_15132, partial [Genlisea aurea]